MRAPDVVRQPPYARSTLVDTVSAGIEARILDKWARALDDPVSARYPWLDERWLRATWCSKCNEPLYSENLMLDRWELDRTHVLHGGAARYEPLPSYVNNEAVHAHSRGRKDEIVSMSDYRAGLESAMAQAAAALARLDATPDPSEYEDGSVFYVRRQYESGGTNYSYAYVKADGKWFGTDRSGSRLSDQDFRQTLMRDDVREVSVATEWAILSGEPAEIEDVDE
jgi:hypothetical protein